MSDIISIERGIQALLSPLMGTPGTGLVSATSTGATGTLPAGSVAIPVGDGDFTEYAAVFVTRNPNTADGSWPITSGGVSVPVESLQGGTIGNHDAGTAFRWFPAIDGIADECTSGAIEGGVTGTGLGTLLQMRMVKQLSADDWKTFLHAQMGAFPAAALVWEGMTSLDGPNFSAPGARSARMGATGMKYKHTWVLYLVTSRLDSATHRRNEGQILVQNVVEELQDRQAGRGLRISSSPGIQILTAGTKSATEQSFIDLVRFETVITIKGKTSSTGNPWLRTRIVAQKNVTGDTRAPIENPDVSVDMLAEDE